MMRTALRAERGKKKRMNHVSHAATRRALERATALRATRSRADRQVFDELTGRHTGCACCYEKERSAELICKKVYDVRRLRGCYVGLHATSTCTYRRKA